MISIDTDVMRQLVAAASATNEAINDAVDALERITTHTDWGCREKTAINEYTQRNKNTIRVLQENSRCFFSTLHQITGEFDTSEQSISGLFSSVDSLISGVLSVVPGLVSGPSSNVTDIPIHGGFVSNFAEIWADIAHSWVISPPTPWIDPASVLEGIGTITTTTTYPHDWDSLVPDAGDLISTAMEVFEVNNILEPIPICRMSDIRL